MKFRNKLIAGLATATLGLGTMVSISAAQEAASPVPQAESAAPAAAVDDGKLKSFAVAFLGVTKVSQTYKPKIEAAKSDSDRQTLQKEAGQEMVEAVNGAGGINIEEYNQIIEAAQTDPDLAQKINTHITEAAGQQPAPAQE